MTELERRALEWVAPFRNARHLVRTRDWVLELRPDAGEPLRLAALGHDAEREVAGGAAIGAQVDAFDDEAMVRAHAERSSHVVAEWLERAGADDTLVGAVAELVALHETGGTPEADVLQAADSLSFLETNPAARWVREGLATPERATQKLHAMHDRIRLPEARAHARPLLARAVDVVRRAADGS